MVKNRWMRLLRNRNNVMLLALILGILFPTLAIELKPTVLWVSALLMTVSLSAFDLKLLRPVRNIFKPAITVFLVNFVLYALILILLLLFVIPDGEKILYTFIAVMLSPPGIVIVPMSLRTKSNYPLATLAVLLGFLMLFILIPVMGLLFPHYVQFEMDLIIKSLVILVAIPLLISRLLRLKVTRKWLEPKRGHFIDILFGVIVYIIIGISQELFFLDFGLIWKTGLVYILFFIFGSLVVYYGAIRLKLGKQNARMLILLLGIKNSGFAAVLAIAADDGSALPVALMSVIQLLFIMFFSYTFDPKEE